jgi:hypothetical protein
VCVFEIDQTRVLLYLIQKLTRWLRRSKLLIRCRKTIRKGLLKENQRWYLSPWILTFFFQLREVWLVTKWDNKRQRMSFIKFRLAILCSTIKVYSRLGWLSWFSCAYKLTFYSCLIYMKKNANRKKNTSIRF